MNYVHLGTTGVQVSALCLGTMIFDSLVQQGKVRYIGVSSVLNPTAWRQACNRLRPEPER
jgi:aryl-alcohol dehydrogenase-like predicted oxidoreductase